ncbi:MAG: hypothetical protein IK077_14995 [Thermoguttaceae bacterium]|nr:hypothetical protein [Thermoguttaceae bacterium]
MTGTQAKQAYRLAYATAIDLLHYNVGLSPAEPYKTKAFEEIGLTEEERARIWKTARDDLIRRHGKWTDEQIQLSEEYAETYAAIYAARAGVLK